MPKRIQRVCEKCASAYNGKTPNKQPILFCTEECQLCRSHEKVTSPDYYGLTPRMAIIANCDRKPKRRRQPVTKPVVKWICRPCALALGGNLNRLHCATIIDAKCDKCHETKRCAELKFYELVSNNLRKD